MDADWNPDERLAARARMHAALGDPHRLAMAEELALGDRSPAWFAQRWGMASNLMAHHVQVLAGAGLVVRLPSEADRRRVFLRLTPQGRAMVPGARVTTDEVVFVCTHNSARSQFAEALWRQRSGIPARSGGTRPAARVHPTAVRVAGRRGADLSRTVPKVVGPEELHDALVVTVCDSADRLMEQPHLHWSVPDPVPAGTSKAFEAAWDDICERIETLAEAARPEKEQS